MSDSELHELRQTIQPYVGQSLILIAVIAFALYGALKTGEWSFLGILFAVSLLYMAFTLAIGFKYKILWNESSIAMRASGLKGERRFAYDEISKIKYEVAASQSRPFRRLVLYKDQRSDDGFIDISLRHFRLEDIDQLMNEIRAHRPDLSAPTVSTKGKVTFP